MRCWLIIKTITERQQMTTMHNPPHAGEVLREWLGDMSVTEAAQRLGVARVTLSRVLNGSSGISAGMALRLQAAFGTSPEMWMGLQDDSECGRLPRPSGHASNLSRWRHKSLAKNSAS